MSGELDEMGETVKAWWAENWLVGVLGLLGGLSLVAGVRSWWADRVPDVAVEIVEEVKDVGEVEEEKTVWVDVAGAVVNPGVYELGDSARVKEAVMAAGGFLENADAEFVAKQINLASRLSDGAKLYVPFEGEGAGIVLGLVGGGKEGVVAVNVNTASQAELEGLWGVGEVRARAIVENRPYSSLGELKDKAGIPESVIEKNKGSLVVE